VRLLVHDVRRHDEVIVSPPDDAAVMAEPDGLPAVVDPSQDLDRSALADVGEARHANGMEARRKKAPGPPVPEVRRITGTAAVPEDVSAVGRPRPRSRGSRRRPRPCRSPRGGCRGSSPRLPPWTS